MAEHAAGGGAALHPHRGGGLNAPRPRRLLTAAAWLAAALAVTVAIGMRVRAHRLADPVQVLRPYLGWLPDGFAARARLVARTRDANGLSLQYEVDGTRAEIRELAGRNRLEEWVLPLVGAEATRWQGEAADSPGAVVHLLLPEGGGPALLTVLDPHPR